jgi:tetratricopeptide (TPR) repeat protein
MKPITTTALALIMAAAATPAAAQYGSMGSSPPPPQQMPEVQRQQAQPQAAPQGQQQNKIQPSKKAMKALIDLQTAVNKNDVATIPAKVAAAQAVVETKEDRYLLAQMQLKAALSANNNAGVAAAVDAIVASGYNSAADNSKLYQSLGATYMNNKQYAEAAAAFQKAAAADATDWRAAALAGEALLAGGQKDQAITAFQRAVQASTVAGNKPEENLYKRAVSVAYEVQSPTAPDLARAWVAAYPSPSSWSDAIAIYRNYNMGDLEATMDLLRLKRALGILTPGEYSNLARAAAEQLIFGEAQAVVNEAVAAKKLDPASPDQRDLVNGLKAKAKPTAADLAAAMKIAANGKALMRIGDNYAAMGDYANAVQAYKLAMAKPDGDASLANLHIGMALARSGDKAGATAALNAVTGARAGIAKYWLTYLAQKA